MMNICSIVTSPKYRGSVAALSDLLLSENAAIAAMVKNNGELLLAPNGKPSKLYADALEIGRQLKEPDVLKFAATIKAITLSNDFKEWFRDSKVTDENGEPLIVWHRSGSEFDAFDLNKSKKDTASVGYHFGTLEASEKVETLTDKSYLYPVFLNLQNPLVCSDEDANIPDRLLRDKLQLSQESIAELRSFNKYTEKQELSDYVGKILRNLGYDGLTYINTVEDPGSRSFVAFQQDLIKSVQNTTFKDNSNIFYSKIYKSGYFPVEFRVYEGQKVPYNVIDLFLIATPLYRYFTERKPELLSTILNINFEVAKPHINKFWDPVTYLEFKGRPAYYDAETNTIRINPVAYFPSDYSEVLWHEIFHALTVNQLASNQKAYNYFNEILEEYKNSGSSLAQQFSEGAHSVEEFVASIWTDPKVIEELKGIKTKNKSSLWNRIKNWISKFFGFTEQGTLFVNASAAIDRILELPIVAQSTTEKFFHSSEVSELNILRLLQYQYQKEGLQPAEITQRLKAYLQGEQSEINRAKKFLDYVQLRRAELHHFGKDFGSEKKNSAGIMDWAAYLHDIDLRTEIDEKSDISEFAELKNYKIEPAEIIVPKIYKSNFKLGSLNLSDIDVNYFKKVNPYYSSNLEKTYPGSIDFLVRTHSSKFNIILTNSFSNKEFTKQLERITPKVEDGWRLDASGNRLYRLPEDLDYELYTDTFGEETLLVKGQDEEIVNRILKLINSTENKVSIQLFANNITPTDNVILDVARANQIKTNNKALRQITKLPEEARKEALKQIYTTQEKQYKNDLANTLYNSFVKSLYMVSVRIPTQHFQSVMAAKVVGLTNDEDNNVFVNRWQFWLQGSDLDIDKSYMMGADISSIGTYNHWSPLADYTSSELAKLSDELPFPTGKELNVKVTDQYDYTETLLAALSDPEEQLTKEDRLKAYAKLLNFAKQHNNTIYVNFDLVNNKIVNQIIKSLNAHNTHQLTAEESRNTIQHLIMQASLDERNMKSSYSPIDDAMDLFKRVLKKMDDPTSLSRNLDDGMLTIARVLFNNSVGKDDVGIMANGLKAFFALTQYFNTFRKNPNFINSNKPFFEHISINGKNINFASISDIQFEQETIKALIAGLLQEGVITPETKIRFANDDAGLLISSLISLATDNAKELALAKMNASIDLACMHLYLATLGCTAPEIVEFATTPEFKELAKKVSRGILAKNSVSAASVIEDWEYNGIHGDAKAILSVPIKFDQGSTNLQNVSPFIAIEQGNKTAFTFIEGNYNYEKLRNLKEGDWIKLQSKSEKGDNIEKYVKITKINKLSDLQDFSIVDWCKKEGLNEEYFHKKIEPYFSRAWQFEFSTTTGPYEKENMHTIYNVWKGALELTKLARLASVNQGVKVNILESTKFINNFENIITDAFKTEKLDSNDLRDRYPALYKKAIEYELIDLESGELSPFNSLRYFKDSDYRNFLVLLYETIKHSFNVLDVINNLPHFYKMLEAFVISQTTLKELSSRSRTVLNDTQSAYNAHNIGTMVENTYYDEYLDKTVTQRKRAFNKVPFSERIYSKANRFYDDAIVSEWLKENGNDYEIDYVDENDQTKQIIPTTNKGVIDYCNFIAYTLIPELLVKLPNNGFLQHIIPNFKRVKKARTELWLPSYKFDFDIDSLLTVLDENKAFYVQKGFDELSKYTLNDLDLEITEGQNIPVTELIYLYNKLVSFAGYGLNTLDAAFDTYLQKLFDKGNPTIALSFSELVLNHDLKKRDDIRIDPLKFLAFCYSNEIRKFQNGIMHYDYDRETKLDQQYDISNIYLFGLEDNLSDFQSLKTLTWVNNSNVVEITQNNSNIDYNSLARILPQLVIEKNEDTYILKSTNTEQPIDFTFKSKAEGLDSVNSVIKEAFNVDPEGLKNFLKEVNNTIQKPKPLGSQLTVQVYKIFANWMTDKFGIPVELISEDKRISGKVENGTIYLNLNSDITTTPIHELMHIVFEFMKLRDFNTFEKVIADLTNSEEAQEITSRLLQDPEYSNLMNLDLLAEVSCRILENMENGNTRTILSIETSETIMQNIAEMLGLSTNNVNLDLLSFLKDTISNLPAYNSLLLAPLKGDHSLTYRDRITKITEGIRKTNIIKRAILMGKLIETEC